MRTGKLDLGWVVFGIFAVAFAVVLLLTEGCQRDDVQQINPLDLPPAKGQEPPKRVFDYECYESLRKQAVDCRTQCFRYAHGTQAPDCYREHVSVHEGIGQTLWEPCESCDLRCGTVQSNAWTAVTSTLPPCKEGEHLLCGYTGPDPHAACWR
jgi:hypothetical protein